MQDVRHDIQSEYMIKYCEYAIKSNFKVGFKLFMMYTHICSSSENEVVLWKSPFNKEPSYSIVYKIAELNSRFCQHFESVVLKATR